MKNIIITGGGGFLGINLTKYLIQKNLDINLIIIDNFITSDIFNIQNIINQYNNIKLYNTNLCHQSTIQLIKENYDSIHEIYHLASIASPPLYKKYDIETLDVGYIGTKNILDLAVFYKQKGIDCKVLFASTSEIYGNPLEHPQKESYYGNVNTVGERSCYDESKRIGETLFYVYNKKFNLNTRIVRIFNTYGPYMSLNDGRIVTETIKSILTGSTLNIYGTGEQTRSLNYVTDTIQMIHGIMNSNESTPVNVGNDIEITINELVEIISNVFNNNKYQFKTQNKLNVTYTGTHNIDKDDPKIRKPCLLKNKRILATTSNFTTLENGILETLIYFYSIYNNT